jgi:hypothetical protein
MKRLFDPIRAALAAVVLFVVWLAYNVVAGITNHMASAGLIAYATLPSKAGAVTLLDFAKSLDPNGSIARVIEMLTQSNEMLSDMRWIEGNLPTGHRSTIRTGLPTTIWRQLYQGVPPSKSTRAQVDDACGMLEARSEVDKDLALLNNDVGAFRLSEAQAFLEAMNQAMAETLMYGNSAANPERFTGLAARYSSLSAGNGANIIDGGGTGTDNTSVWLVVWGENTITGIYPKGSQAGLLQQDLGEIDAFDGSNNRYRALAERFQWKGGLALRDWRYVVRVANIDVSDLVGQTATQASTAATIVMKLMIKAIARIPFMGMGTPVFYAGRTVKEMLAIAALDKSQQALSIEPATQQFGQVTPGFTGNGTMRFLGVPVRTCDRILETEARVV